MSASEHEPIRVARMWRWARVAKDRDDTMDPCGAAPSSLRLAARRSRMGCATANSRMTTATGRDHHRQVSPDVDDHALVDAWQRGDKQASVKLFDRYFAPISRFF